MRVLVPFNTTNSGKFDLAKLTDFSVLQKNIRKTFLRRNMQENGSH